MIAPADALRSVPAIEVGRVGVAEAEVGPSGVVLLEVGRVGVPVREVASAGLLVCDDLGWRVGGFRVGPSGFFESRGFLAMWLPFRRLTAERLNVGGPKPVSCPPSRPRRQPSRRIPGVAV